MVKEHVCASHLVPRWRAFQHVIIAKCCHDIRVLNRKTIEAEDLILLKVPDNERSVLLLVSKFINKHL